MSSATHRMSPNNRNVGCTHVGADNYSAEAVWDEKSTHDLFD